MTPPVGSRYGSVQPPPARVAQRCRETQRVCVTSLVSPLSLDGGLLGLVTQDQQLQLALRPFYTPSRNVGKNAAETEGGRKCMQPAPLPPVVTRGTVLDSGHCPRLVNSRHCPSRPQRCSTALLRSPSHPSRPAASRSCGTRSRPSRLAGSRPPLGPPVGPPPGAASASCFRKAFDRRLLRGSASRAACGTHWQW